MPSSSRLGSRLRAALLLASASTASCALQVHEGDGLVSDGREVAVQPTVVWDAGRGAQLKGDASIPECKHLPLFVQHVMPVLTTKYPASPEPISCMECHDGTKGMALLGLPLSRDPELLEANCVLSLFYGATKPDPLQAELLSSSDPSGPDVEHDFKFKTVEEYNRFRDAILPWLQAEKVK